MWDDWAELDPRALPKRVERHCTIVPTVWFSCEDGRGLLAHVDNDTFEVRKLEGHPDHAASRGHLCAKGPATINQIQNPDRILYPLRRAGRRGEGKWERVSRDEALDDIASRMRTAMDENRRDEITYHIGRPGDVPNTLRLHRRSVDTCGQIRYILVE